MYGTYHMKDPATFYNREDLWTFPRENYSDQTVPMQPYYVIMRLPGETRAEYILMLPMVPQGRGQYDFVAGRALRRNRLRPSV